MDELDLFETNNCQNCAVLVNYCKALQSQLKILSEKVDSLTNHVLRKTSEIGTQSDISAPINSVFCSTKDLTSFTNVFTQTDPDHDESNPSPPVDDPENLISVQNYQQTGHSSSAEPFNLIPNKPFEQFNLQKLDRACDYQIQLENRHMAFYGHAPYKYGSIEHKARPFEDNSYLCSILEHLKLVLPDLIFNSALVTKFRDGNDHLNFHSDNEPEIHNNSCIATISLGFNRIIEFSPLNSLNHQLISLNATHGTVYCMSRESQNLYKHRVLKNSSSQPRISITVRYLKPDRETVIQQPSLIDPYLNDSHMISNSRREPLSLGPIEHQSYPDAVEPRPRTLYISSSMFSELSALKLSTPSQNASVLSYRGATAGGILIRLQNDPNFISLQPQTVTKVFVLCGTNNVDRILNIPFPSCSSSVRDTININESMLNSSFQEIDQLHQFLSNWNPNANLNFVNILPRVSLARNQVINRLNAHLSSRSINNPNTNFINTESTRHLFCSDGYRKNFYFSNKGSDNVHLNRMGILRLGKHLKYSAHT